jgi:hypothetical protein
VFYVLLEVRDLGLLVVKKTLQTYGKEEKKPI